MLKKHPFNKEGVFLRDILNDIRKFFEGGEKFGIVGM